MKTSEDGLLFLMEKNGVIRVGLTAKAQDDLGSVSFVNLPKVGTNLELGESFAEVEAEKAVNELVSPVAGEVVAIHTEAEKTPEILDSQEVGAAWLMDVKAN